MRMSCGNEEPGLFRQLFPISVKVAEMDPRLASFDLLYPEEQAQVASSVPQRRLEYAAVRQLARPLIEGLGGTPGLLLNGMDRAPRWPEGIVGSFSHTKTLAVAAVALRREVAALGCDVEPCCPLPGDIVKMVVTAHERELLPSGEPWLERIVFSAKEAVYKAQYPLTFSFLDFHDVCIELDQANGSFLATLHVDAGPFRRGHLFRGKFAVASQLIATAVTIPRDACAAAKDNDADSGLSERLRL